MTIANVRDDDCDAHDDKEKSPPRAVYGLQGQATDARFCCALTDTGYAAVVTLAVSERARHVVHANRSRPRDQHARYFHRARQVATEAIAHATYGFEKILVARRLQRLAQAPDVHVDSALLDVHVVAPDLVEQLGARVDAARVRHEEAQHAEFEGAH